TSLPASSIRMHRRNVSVNSSPSKLPPPLAGEGRGGGLSHRSLHGRFLDAVGRPARFAGNLRDAGRFGQRQGQGQREDGALVGRAALYRQGPAVALSQPSADEEAEPRSGHVAEGGIGGSVEPLENPLAFAFSNSGTVVRNPHHGA